MPEVLFETHVIGAYLKVTAVDPVTGIEAVVSGPAGAGEVHIRQLALRKLEYLLKKQQEQR